MTSFSQNAISKNLPNLSKYYYFLNLQRELLYGQFKTFKTFETNRSKLYANCYVFSQIRTVTGNAFFSELYVFKIQIIFFDIKLERRKSHRVTCWRFTHISRERLLVHTSTLTWKSLDKLLCCSKTAWGERYFTCLKYLV